MSLPLVEVLVNEVEEVQHVVCGGGVLEASVVNWVEVGADVVMSQSLMKAS